MYYTTEDERDMLKIQEAINYLTLPGQTLEDLRLVFNNVWKKHPALFNVFVDKFWTEMSRKGGLED